MITEGYRYKFGMGVSLCDAEDTLLLALLAAEGIYGECRVRMDAAYAVDEALGAIVVDAATEVGQDVCGMFTAFLTRQFGPRAFRVRRIEGSPGRTCR